MISFYYRGHIGPFRRNEHHERIRDCLLAAQIHPHLDLFEQEPEASEEQNLILMFFHCDGTMLSTRSSP